MQSVELSTSGSTGPPPSTFGGLLTTRQLGLEARWLVGRPFTPLVAHPFTHPDAAGQLFALPFTTLNTAIEIVIV